jgi:hypothetical protein
MDERQPRRYRFGPHPQAGWILGLRGSQILGIATAMAVILLVSRAAGGSLLLIVYLALIALVTWLVVGLQIGGHSLLEWGPVAGRYGFLRASGAATFTADTGSYVTEVTTAETLVVSEPEPCVSLPAELSDVEILETTLPRFGGVPLGVVYDRRANTYTATVRAIAHAFYLLSEDERARKLAQYGALLVSFSQEYSPVNRIAWYQRTFMGKSHELMDYYLQNRREGISERQDEAMWQLLEAQETGNPDRELFMSLQINMTRMAASTQAAKLGRGDSKEGALALIAEYVAKLVDELAHIGLLTNQPTSVSNPAVPTARQLAQIIRDGFDPFTRGDREIAPAGQAPGVEPQAFGPLFREIRPGYVHADTALHTSGHLAQWPRTDVRATFLQGLLMDVAANRTVAVVMDILPPRQAIRQAERAAEARESEGYLRRRIGRRESARDRQQRTSTLIREEELAEGHALVKFAGYVTVSVPADENVPGGGHAGLTTAWGRVQASALSAGLRLEREVCQQDQVLTHTIVGLGRGLV